jgi:hypothetical protein
MDATVAKPKIKLGPGPRLPGSKYLGLGNDEFNRATVLLDGG